ncbi:glycosyl hydrolase family 109 [Bacteroides fragilis]|nr:glycosyl hydrolase family 109 [Bacteroides fragilis]MCE8574926.1 Gfo/Idh/MocA family oxidoreductase [Bacteroides fragilis]QCQ31109.1 Gfo/Idh/MocA family oxidoreductase [Bacteroides fragilis]UHZ84059.1 Gfo/Idh/MocA family oxidoreductase [Bacteroides fragilis]
MKSIINKMILGACVAFALFAFSMPASAQSLSPSTKWHWEKGTIIVDTPELPAEQQPVIGLTAPKLKVVRVGFVGLGMRGPGAVERFTHIPGVQIVALCDYEEKRAERCQKYLREASLPPAAIYSGEKGYEDLCKREDIDLVYIATDWDHHFPVAKCAMENGKHTAIEVPSAMNLEQCWELINLSEQTRKHCMILENCCYDWFEMNTLNMAQQGVFGEVLRAQGAYIHNLDDFWDYYWKNGKEDKLGWRLRYNKENRGDVYATHGLGPVAQALDIHRGDRMTTLVAMDTKSVSGREHVKKATGEECDSFRNGDHTTTLIRTANGKVIEIQHDVMNPQPYNRLYQLTGTKGFANKYPVEGYAVDAKQMKASGVQPKVDNLSTHSFLPKSEMDALVAKYQHPILKKYGEMAKEVGGHGGMDFIMDSRLVYCLQNGLPLDMDVYDLAEWCCLAELGALSMDNGCAAVAFPDFTRGHWNDVKGFKHAFASEADEAEAEKVAKEATAQLKEQGAKEWAKIAKKEAKAAKKKAKK